MILLICGFPLHALHLMSTEQVKILHSRYKLESICTLTALFYHVDKTGILIMATVFSILLNVAEKKLNRI